MSPKKKSKRTTPLDRLKVFFSIYDSIKEHGKLPQKSEYPNLPNRLDKYVIRLKKLNLVKKVGYGTWQIKSNNYTLREALGVATTTTPLNVVFPQEIKQEKKSKMDDVRAHNLVFRLKVETPLSWEARLRARDADFSLLKSGVVRIVYEGFKVWLCQGCVVIYFPPSVDFRASSVDSSLSLAVRGFFALLPGLESFLGFSLRSRHGGYEWSLDRKHLSLVKNALAQDYNSRKEKLVVSDLEGVWMIADFSHEENELEFIRSKTNTSETKIVKHFFSDLVKNPMTLSELAGILGGSMKLHNELAQEVIKLKERIDSL